GSTKTLLEVRQRKRGRKRPRNNSWNNHLCTLCCIRLSFFSGSVRPCPASVGPNVFTGIISDIGTIERVADGPAGRELRVRSAYVRLSGGESIALNGACLTVREHGDGWFSVAAVVTTLERTEIGSWEPGTRVNLERALRAGDRLGGHLVQGHVDDTGTVVAARTEGDARLVDVRLPRELAELVVPHGSIALDGVSLTVNEMP